MNPRESRLGVPSVTPFMTVTRPSFLDCYNSMKVLRILSNAWHDQYENTTNTRQPSTTSVQQRKYEILGIAQYHQHLLAEILSITQYHQYPPVEIVSIARYHQCAPTEIRNTWYSLVSPVSTRGNA